MDLNPIILSIPIYFLLIGIELIVQAFQKNIRYRLSDAITNISCGITDQVAGVFFKVFGLFLYTATYSYFRIFEINETWYTFLFVFIGTDLCYYWAHRMSHHVNLFWNGHVVHHQSEDYNLSVALRQGAFQTFFSAPFYLPMAVLGCAPEFFLYATAFVTLYQFWIHTENIGKMGWFEKLFNTPSHHRVHHGVNPKYIDRNHAGVFIIWDKLFGTFQEEDETPTYGITVPVQSWNPVKAHFTPFKLMWESMQQGRGLVDKLKIMLMPPGWFPDYAGGFKAPPKVEKSTYSKYSIEVNSSIKTYTLIQYILTLGLTSLFLFLGTQLPKADLTLCMISIIGSIAIIGSLLELRKWSFYAEVLRLFAIPALLFYFMPQQLLAIGSATVVSIVSLALILKLKTNFTL